MPLKFSVSQSAEKYINELVERQSTIHVQRERERVGWINLVNTK